LTEEDQHDQDLYQVLTLQAGDPSVNRVSGTFLGRLSEDIDGHNRASTGFSVFDDITDTYQDNVNGRFYLGYVDLRRFGWMDRSQLELIRVGRQSYEETAETLIFDGGRIESRPFEDLHGLRLTAYGGLPVHYFESSPSGDAVVGAGAEAKTLPGGRARADWTYVEDRREEDQERAHLISLALWQAIGRRFSLHGRYNLLDGQSRDYLVRGTYNEERADLLFQASFHQFLKTLRDLPIELDPYFSVVRELRPYWEVDLRASKGLGEHFVVDGGVDFRELRHEDQEGSFNHEFQRYYLTPSTRDFPFKGTTISVTAEYWQSSDDIFTAGGEVSQRLFRVFVASAGTYYSLYKFDLLSERERTHVRTYFGRLEYQLARNVKLQTRYEYERDDQFHYHTVEIGVRYAF